MNRSKKNYGLYLDLVRINAKAVPPFRTTQPFQRVLENYFTITFIVLIIPALPFNIRI